MSARSTLALALALGATAAVAMVAPASASVCGGATTPASEQSSARLSGSVLCLINQERSAAGRRPVRANGKLRRAAAKHSADMVSNGYFEHTTPGGVSFVDRIDEAGYMRGARSWLVGENLAWGSGSQSTPEQLVTSWMQSPPHRANLLRARFREVGVAAVVGTPMDSSDGSGVTVSSEYGFRASRR